MSVSCFLRPEINCSPFTVGREVVLSFSEGRRRGRRSRELGREVQKEKEWPFADSRPLCRSEVFSLWQLIGGKTNQQFSDNKEGQRRKERAGLTPHFLTEGTLDQHMLHAAMASAAPPKRMVSSVFITLAPPYRATVTQQQPTLQAHSSPARDTQHAALRAGPGDSIPAPRHKKDDRSSPGSYRSVDKPRGRALDATSPKTIQHEPRREELQEDDRGSAELSSPPPSMPSSLGTARAPESAPPPPPPGQTPPSHTLTPSQQPVYNREVETKTPSSGSNQDEQLQRTYNNSQDTSKECKEVCGFCRKPVALTEPAIEALNRTYHDGCFQCRSCHIPLAGKQYYNKSGIPLCEACYQASLEVCWSCGEVITDHVIRALERAYHLSCFTCTTCKQKIGEQAFAQGEVGEVYCLQDYYKKYAPLCHNCKQLIIPKEDGTDSYTVECLGHSYHENCYRCEICVIQLSPEPNERGCYPLDGKLLCKSCHLDLVSGQH